MPRPRFFIEAGEIGRTVLLGGREARHLRTVLRLQPGSQIELCDGSGDIYLAELTSVGARPEAKIIERRRVPAETPDVHLYQALPKGAKMDVIIRQVSEVGVDAITPVVTARSVPRVAGGPPGRLARWQRVAFEAAKQSRRARVCRLGLPISFAEAVAQASTSDTVLFFWEEAQGHPVLHENLRRVAVFVGPEGGFAPEEVELARSIGAVPVGLGSRILRAETAAVVAVALTMYWCGRLGGKGRP